MHKKVQQFKDKGLMPYCFWRKSKWFGEHYPTVASMTESRNEKKIKHRQMTGHYQKIRFSQATV